MCEQCVADVKAIKEKLEGADKNPFKTQKLVSLHHLKMMHKQQPIFLGTDPRIIHCSENPDRADLIDIWVETRNGDGVSNEVATRFMVIVSDRLFPDDYEHVGTITTKLTGFTYHIYKQIESGDQHV